MKRGRKKERMRRKEEKGEEKYEKEAGSRQEKKIQISEEVSFLRQRYCEVGKVDSRREKKKRRETRKKQGLPFGLCSIFFK
jgi:predicted adenine nucleotide alpha hydrolase (AANH) superfamily ATPase